VKDPRVEFVSESYPELWERWSQNSELKAHVAAMQSRYLVEA
jgi:hypothetical protein